LSDKKINLLGYSLESLEAFFNDIGEPKFRARQLIKWVHQKGVLDFSQMTDFNKILREKLELIACLITPMVEKFTNLPRGQLSI
jgi:23S rRNA (adenine2503-C2)-methyltransferase